MAFPFIGKTEAQDFRLQLYNSFEKRNDLTFELIDALSSQTNPSSGIGLSLSSLFTRKQIKPHCFCKLAEIYFVVYMFKYIFPVCQS